MSNRFPPGLLALLGWLCTGAIAVMGCGGGDSGGTCSCTLTENVGSLGNIQICEEGSGSARNAIVQACKSPNTASGAALADAGVTLDVTVANRPCTHVNAVGGCQVTQNGMTVAVWYYQDPDLSNPVQTNEVQSLCAGIGATYLPP